MQGIDVDAIQKNFHTSLRLLEEFVDDDDDDDDVDVEGEFSIAGSLLLFREFDVAESVNSIDSVWDSFRLSLLLFLGGLAVSSSLGSSWALALRSVLVFLGVLWKNSVIFLD